MTALTILGIIDIIAGLTVGAIAMLTNDSGVYRTALTITVIMVTKGVLSIIWD